MKIQSSQRQRKTYLELPKFFIKLILWQLAFFEKPVVTNLFIKLKKLTVTISIFHIKITSFVYQILDIY